MATRNSEDTRRRLLEAAAAEFAAYGIAGARVDRIAAAAQCNKQAIYAYFGSKEALGDAVIDGLVEQIVESVPIDARDLPGYAVRLFDRCQSHPDVMRLAMWYQLEGKPLPAAAVASTAHKIEAIRRAQADGVVSERFSAEMMLLWVIALSRVGSPDSPEAKLGVLTVEATREAIAAAVRRLVEP
ncbi:TetR/AcrR family transcriptional regulator [Pseudomonas sp. CGJS7]|uniref:TetR/AcrR family transcriptional regulator n=1 Tax=Pseudomonas sp. CGJS7 TaxID=3109348 RepID=UPI0030088EC4